MPPAEMQRLFGFTVDPTAKSGNLFFHHQERLTNPKTTFLDDAKEGHPLKWDSLWIDMGGEG